MTVRLRPESASDETFVRRLVIETIADELGAAAWPEPMRNHLLGIQYIGRRQSDRLRLPESASYIIEADAEAAGWLVTTTLPHEIWLDEIMVLTALRGNGIGTSVIRGVLADAAQKEIPARLNVNKTNHAAIRLYEGLGFRPIDGNEVRQVMECLASVTSRKVATTATPALWGGPSGLPPGFRPACSPVAARLRKTRNHAVKALDVFGRLSSSWAHSCVGTVSLRSPAASAKPIAASRR